MDKNNYLNWEIDVSAFRLFGRELITDRITAIFELVKNCYDANAEKVDVEFYNVSSNSPDSKIIIKDTGTGMSLYDIKTKWMVIGTNSKRIKEVTDPPYYRRVIGEKGIGRFAVDKLGSRLLLKTKRKNDKEKACVEIDWKKYEKISSENDSIEEKKEKSPNFTDIKNYYYFENESEEYQGTELIISGVNDIWTDIDIERVYEELSKLVSPFENLKPGFQIWLYSNEIDKYKTPTEIKNESIEYATFSKKITARNNKQQSLYFNEQKEKLEIKSTALENFGPVDFRIYYFDAVAKKQFNRKNNKTVLSIDGIKIYRDGIITTPFAEYESDKNKQRDILGLDKRRWSGFWDKIGSRDLIAFVHIKKDKNPKIQEATNRQDFVDNKEFRQLKKFIFHQIIEIENYLKYLKKKEKESKSGDDHLVGVKSSIDSFFTEIKEIEDSHPEFKDAFNGIKKKLTSIAKAVNLGINQQERLVKENEEQKQLFFSLMSLQDFAAELAHIVRTALGRIIRLAKFFKNNYPDPQYENEFKAYSNEIYDEMQKLKKAVDFMLSYSKSKIGFEEINLKELVIDLFNNIYFEILKKEHIKTLVEMQDNLILHHNKRFIIDIFENLLTNSIKALKLQPNKIIKCSSTQNEKEFIIYFSDNGCGIPDENKYKIFDVYETTTEAEGGAGIGLFSVKTRIEALKGDIEVIKNEYKPSGATFMIRIPYKFKRSN